MDSKKLEILMTAIDLGSFTKASEVVGYTQSGLTHMMDALEREVGFSLLQRDHNGIQLSPQGRQLMPAIREFLQANANLENQINAISEQKRRSSALRPTPASPCTGCRSCFTATSASARMSAWISGWWITRWSPTSCWKAGRPT